MDKIHINGLRIYSNHGVKPEEKEKGQPFILDIIIEADLKQVCKSDNLNETVNYSSAVKTVTKEMTSRSYDLIECAAENVAQALLNEYDLINAVNVVLKKPRAPISADFEYVAVEIYRTR